MFKGIILLGNPGKKYETTRHNLAWATATELPDYNNLIWIKKFKGRYARYGSNTRQILLKPEVFMNRSGESVLAFLQFFKFTPRDLLVVHDDLELDFGIISLKEGGGLGGHNGLRSIATLLASRDFFRFRLGISRPARGTVSSYVLSPFSREESCHLGLYLKRSADYLARALSLTAQQATGEIQKINTLELT